MRALIAVLMIVCCVGLSGLAYAESNAVAKGVDQVTYVPVKVALKGNEAMNSPIHEVGGGLILITEMARQGIIRVFNLGKDVDE